MKSTIGRGLINKFNRGVISKSFFAREDVERLADSAETMTNFIPRKIGPMSFRPGFEQRENAIGDNPSLWPFVRATDEAFIIKYSASDGGFKWIDPSTRVFREAERTTTTVDQFQGSGLGGWTNLDAGSATSTETGGNLEQVGTGVDAAKIYQQITGLTSGVHHYRFDVEEGPVTVKLGSEGSDSGDLFQGELDTGVHVIGVDTGGTTLDITISNSRKHTTKLDAIEGFTSGQELIFSPSGHIPNFADPSSYKYTWTQSADVLYLDPVDKRGRPIETVRWNEYSLGVQIHRYRNGPYRSLNISPITLDPSDGEGDANMVASSNLWSTSYAPEYLLVRYASPGQTVTATGTTDAVETLPILVFGSGNARKFTVIITETSGNYGEIHLEQSFDAVTWVKVKQWVGADNSVLETYDDGLDGSEIYYRLQVETIGTADVTLTLIYNYGIIEGEFTSGNLSAAPSATSLPGYWEVEPGNADATYDYYLGTWTRGDVSANNRFPTAITAFEGRLWHGGLGEFWSTVSDDYNNYSTLVEGDSAAIKKTIGFGPVDQISWMAGTDYLLAGYAGGILNIRSNSFSVPMTPENTNIRRVSTMGAAAVKAEALDAAVLFVDRGKRRLIKFNFDGQKGVPEDLNLFSPDIFDDDIIRVEVTRTPETRVWVLLDNRDLWTCLYEDLEQVLAWSKIDHGEGGFDDICALPGDDEDELWVVVRDVSVERLQVLGKFSESFPGWNPTQSYRSPRVLDGWETFSSPSGTTNSYLTAGTTVATWEDGVYQGTQVLGTGGSIAYTPAITELLVGFEYTATWKSNKLTDHGDVASINQRQRIVDVGFVLTKYYYEAGAFKYGPSESYLRDMPLLENGKAPVGGDYDFIPVPFPSENKVDPRIVVQTTLPVEVLAIAYNMKHTAEKTPERGG